MPARWPRRQHHKEEGGGRIAQRIFVHEMQSAGSEVGRTGGKTKAAGPRGEGGSCWVTMEESKEVA